jgi:2-keto-4-pentenoate hydratase
LAFYVTLIGGFMAVVALIGLMSRGGERLTRGVVVLTGAALVGFGAYQVLHGTGLL